MTTMAGGMTPNPDQQDWDAQPNQTISTTAHVLHSLRSRPLGLLAGLIVTGLPIAPAIAADQLVVTYGAFHAAFAISDLQTLAETGEVPSSIELYLELAGVTSEELRLALTSEVTVSHRFLDNLLNTEGGEYTLTEVTQVIHTPSQQASVQALRSALIAAASDDQQISLLELLQTYPTQQVYINGGNLIQLARDLTAEPIADRPSD
jgi:hypothetical protein